MGSKRKGAGSGNRKAVAVTRRQQHQLVRRQSQAPLPHAAAPAAPRPGVEQAAPVAVETQDQALVAGAMVEPAPPVAKVETSDAAQATGNDTDQSGPVAKDEAEAEAEAEADRQATEPLQAMKHPDGRRRYPTLARMASIASRSPAESQPAAPPPAPVTEPARATHDARDSGAPTTPGAQQAQPTRNLHRKRTAMPRPRPLARLDLVLVVASVHAALAVVAALTGAILLLAGEMAAVWALALAGLAGLGGWLAFAVAQSERSRRFAVLLLTCSQLGVLFWVMALLGPRVSLLLLAPAAAFFALRASGRGAAVFAVAGALVGYAVFVAHSLSSAASPVLLLAPEAGALFDGGVSALGLLLALAGAFGASAGRARAELLAQARQGEIRRLRARVAQLRRQSEDDAALLYQALDAALAGEPDDGYAHTDGVFSPVMARIAEAGEQVADLRDDVREGKRLESAVGRLALALERAWLGVAWSWPAPTGTRVDDIAALLRAPSPRQLPWLVADEPPSGPIPVPTDPEMAARRRVIPTPRTAPHAATSSATDLGPDVAFPRAQPLARAARHTTPLHWSEWDEWRDWRTDSAR